MCYLCLSVICLVMIIMNIEYCVTRAASIWWATASLVARRINCALQLHALLLLFTANKFFFFFFFIRNRNAFTATAGTHLPTRRDGRLSRPWCRGRDSNLQPPDCKSGTLPHSHLLYLNCFWSFATLSQQVHTPHNVVLIMRTKCHLTIITIHTCRFSCEFLMFVLCNTNDSV